MAHTYCRLLVHVVFATKERLPLLTPELKKPLFSFMVGVCRNLDTFVHEIDGVADHCHLLIDLPARLALADVVRKIKSNSSRWANERDPKCKFGWQRGYGAFSISQTQVPFVVSYIRGQEEHHRKLTLQEELRHFLQVHGYAGDPEFIAGAEE